MKGQTEIVGYLILFLVGIGLATTAIMWGVPLIHKKQDAKKLDDIHNLFISLNEKVKSVAKGGVEESLTFPQGGVITIYPWNYSGPENNSIVFKIPSKVSNVAVSEEWIPITTVNVKESPYAILGIDQPSVIFVSSKKAGNYFEVSYRIWFRGLYDPSTGKTYKIILVNEDRSSNARSSTSSVVFMKPGNIEEKVINGKTYLLTEVVINL